MTSTSTPRPDADDRSGARTRAGGARDVEGLLEGSVGAGWWGAFSISVSNLLEPTGEVIWYKIGNRVAPS